MGDTDFVGRMNGKIGFGDLFKMQKNAKKRFFSHKNGEKCVEKIHLLGVAGCGTSACSRERYIYWGFMGEWDGTVKVKDTFVGGKTKSRCKCGASACVREKIHLLGV